MPRGIPKAGVRKDRLDPATPQDMVSPSQRAGKKFPPVNLREEDVAWLDAFRGAKDGKDPGKFSRPEAIHRLIGQAKAVAIEVAGMPRKDHK